MEVFFFNNIKIEHFGYPKLLAMMFGFQGIVVFAQTHCTSLNVQLYILC